MAKFEKMDWTLERRGSELAAYHKTKGCLQ